MRGVPSCILCLPFYFMAVVALSFELLPREAFAIFRVQPAGETLGISLAFAGVFLILGVALHVILYRLSPEKFDARAFRRVGSAMIVTLAGLYGLSAVLARGTRLPPTVLSERFHAVMFWIGVVITGLVIVLFALAGAWLFVSLRQHPGNRIARRLARGDIPGAIRIGESKPAETRDFTTNLNLGVAYVAAGRTEEARRILSVLEQIKDTPPCYTQETFDTALAQLRELVGRDTGSNSG